MTRPKPDATIGRPPFNLDAQWRNSTHRESLLGALAAGAKPQAACTFAGIPWSTYRQHQFNGRIARAKQLAGAPLTPKETADAEFLAQIEGASVTPQIEAAAAIRLLATKGSKTRTTTKFDPSTNRELERVEVTEDRLPLFPAAQYALERSENAVIEGPRVDLEVEDWAELAEAKAFLDALAARKKEKRGGSGKA